MTTTQKTGRTRWSKAHVETLRPMLCPKWCGGDYKEITGIRRNEDALTYGAIKEYRLSCGHVRTLPGALITK
jgi:hypothetical protein